MSSDNGPTQMSMFSSEEHPVSPSPSRDSGLGLLTLGETSRSSILRSLNDTAPHGWYGKTSPVSCQATEDGTLVPLSQGWSNSGIARPGECLTLSTSDVPQVAAGFSWSRFWETGAHLQKYYLRPTACAWILRRAESGNFLASMQITTRNGDRISGSEAEAAFRMQAGSEG